MKKRLVSLTMIFFILIGCTSIGTYNTQENITPMGNFRTIKIVDSDGNHIADAKISGKLKYYRGTLRKMEFNNWSEENISLIREEKRELRTNEVGETVITTDVVPSGKVFTEQIKENFEYISIYKVFETKFENMKAEKKGFYSTTVEDFEAFKNYNNKEEDPFEIILYKAEDYFKKEFLNNQEYNLSRKQIKEVIDVVKFESYLRNVKLQHESIGIYKFKNKKYLEMSLKSKAIYNSVRLDKYDVGKRLYDDSVVKLLNHLVLIDGKVIDGFNLRVTGYMKNALNENKIPKPILYEFIMDKDMISKYKNKDITSQKLLDTSVILMDDERIELKLQ